MELFRFGDTVASSWYPLQYHWHAPSEHTVDGHLFDAELHFVHTNTEGQYAVLGVFFREEACAYIIPAVLNADGTVKTAEEDDDEKNAKCMEDRAVSDTFFDSLTAFGENREPSFDFSLENVDVQAFLDDLNLNNFWSYNGSFTTPPCTEGVRWTVLHADVPISKDHMDALNSYHVDNSEFA